MGSLYDLLKKRRMVRHYTGEPAPRDALERIVETVRRAPSAGFSQGQRLLVVDAPELLARIAALADDDPLEGVEPWFETAAAQVFVMTRESDYHDRYQRDDKLQDGEEIEWPVPFWHVDAGAAMMLLLSEHLSGLEVAGGLAIGASIVLERRSHVRELALVEDPA